MRRHASIVGLEPSVDLLMDNIIVLKGTGLPHFDAVPDAMESGIHCFNGRNPCVNTGQKT